MEEIEVKFLNINQAEIEKRLVKIGATKIADIFYKRTIFDYPDLRLHKRGAWIRVRNDGSKTTLTFKQRLGVQSETGIANDQGMEEIEIQVDDFKKTCDFLHAIGLKEKFYEENKRTRWQKGSVEFDIDLWPQLNPYLEIEGETWAQVQEAAMKLELNWSEHKIFSAHQVYKLAGIDEHDYQKITFEEMIKKNND